MFFNTECFNANKCLLVFTLRHIHFHLSPTESGWSQFSWISGLLSASPHFNADLGANSQLLVSAALLADSPTSLKSTSRHSTQVDPLHICTPTIHPCPNPHFPDKIATSNAESAAVQIRPTWTESFRNVFPTISQLLPSDKKSRTLWILKSKLAISLLFPIPVTYDPHYWLSQLPTCDADHQFVSIN